MPHGHHIYAKASDMEMATMCAYPQSDHTITHWIYALQCCAKFTCVIHLDQERYDQYSITIISITFHIYHLILCCTTHERIPLDNKKFCRMCKQDSTSE